ncbi:MAG TPA: hypothetical protein VKS00_05565 [Candidatus Acidoferrales bacterium]|nr:hypothetical protein [Candidatus Acidoferrales bacterium]
MAASPVVRRSDVRHETRDAYLPALVILGGVMAMTIAVALIGMRFLFFSYAKARPAGPGEAPFVTQRVLPPEPRLQPTPRRDLAAYLEAQTKELDTYGWVDRQNGVVRIPIDRAMQLLLTHGLPVRRSEQPPTRQNTDGRANTTRGAGHALDNTDRRSLILRKERQ